MPSSLHKDHEFWCIAAFVVSVHVVCVIWSLLTLEAKPQIPKVAQRLVVQTVALMQPKVVTTPPASVKQVEIAEPIKVAEPVTSIEVPESVEVSEPVKIIEAKPLSSSPPTVQIKEKPKPKPKPQPKKVEKKKSVKPTPVVEKKKPAPKPVDNKNKELLAKAQERIAKIQVPSGRIGASKVASRPELKIPQLQTASKSNDDSTVGWSSGEVGYRDELASRLKLQMRLPEYGEVKVKLTLKRAGRFVKVVIVSAESKANRQYIEKTIPTLIFPPFGHNFEAMDEYTFSITLSNEL